MIPIKTKEEIEVMAKGGHLLKKAIHKISLLLKEGIETIELENKANEIIKELGQKPSFKGENSFPFSLCVSINEEIVHGLPSKRKLKTGDIVTLDFGIFFKLEKFLGKDFNKEKYPNLLNGFHTDMARTFSIGEIDQETKRLLTVTRKMLRLGIKKVKPGRTIGDLGETMQRYAKRQGFHVVKGLYGHGIGKDLHETPDIPNYGKRHTGAKLIPGMVFCIEPMLSMGSDDIKLSKNNFTFATKDNSLSAHFEDMVAVTENGVRVLTL